MKIGFNFVRLASNCFRSSNFTFCCPMRPYRSSCLCSVAWFRYNKVCVLQQDLLMTWVALEVECGPPLLLLLFRLWFQNPVMRTLTVSACFSIVKSWCRCIFYASHFRRTENLCFAFKWNWIGECLCTLTLLLAMLTTWHFGNYSSKGVLLYECDFEIFELKLLWKYLFFPLMKSYVCSWLSLETTFFTLSSWFLHSCLSDLTIAADDGHAFE